MDENHRAEFLENVRKSLRVDGKRDREDLFRRKAGCESADIPEMTRRRGASSRLELLQITAEAAGQLNISLVTVKGAPEAGEKIAELAREKNPEWGDEKSVVLWNHPLVLETNVENLLRERNIRVFFPPCAGKNEKDVFIKDSAAAFIGVTSADYCVAETATLVLKAAPGRERSVSLLPSIHVAVIKLEQVVADFKELYALLDRDLKENPDALEGGMTFITGPSKTADIEATMVRGAHGPRELYIYVVTGT
jgi:L-lactate dehydrogenase complex protein LldG